MSTDGLVKSLLPLRDGKDDELGELLGEAAAALRRLAARNARLTMALARARKALRRRRAGR